MQCLTQPKPPTLNSNPKFGQGCDSSLGLLSAGEGGSHQLSLLGNPGHVGGGTAKHTSEPTAPLLQSTSLLPSISIRDAHLKHPAFSHYLGQVR